MENKMGFKFITWKKRANYIQNKIRRDKEALIWWKENKEKVYSLDFMSEYTIDEKLPLLENTNKYEEQLYSCLRNCNFEKIRKGELLYEAIMSSFWRLRAVMGERNRIILEDYYINNRTMIYISKKLKISVQAVGKYLKKFKNLVLADMKVGS